MSRPSVTRRPVAPAARGLRQIAPSARASLLLTLTCLTLLHLLSLALFARGFLLTRVEVPYLSSCSDFPSSPPSDGCWSPPRFRRVVLLVVDGLRWDVASGQARSAVPDRLLALPRLAELGRTSGVLFPFVADPPTTTQQRLKALLTGSLPTFLDAGASFGAPALLEDNLVAQAAGAGRRLAVLGDDTWLQLFPHTGEGNGSDSSSVWSVAHPFPSFNVRDLHTCDSGVASQLSPLLAQPARWDLLIAHFLGVDHAGHTHGVDSPEMADKLQEMDAMAAQVHAQLAADPAHADTLLLLIGDHGMTWSGDHGGASEPEVTSALFASAPGRRRSGVRTGDVDASPMPQLDFAATLSLLMGLPIPFANMGRLERRLWELGGYGGEGFEAALRANAGQVLRALRAYEAAGALPSPGVRQLAAMAEAAEAEGLSQEGVKGTQTFLDQAAALARAEWTKFGTAAMTAGLAGLLLCLAAHARALRTALAPAATAAAPPSAFGPVAALSLLAILAHAMGSFSVGCMHSEAEFGHFPSLAIGTLHALRALHSRRSSPPQGARALLPPLALPLLSVAMFALRMHGEDKPPASAAGRPSLLSALSGVAPLLLIPELLIGSRSGLVPTLAWGAHVAAAARLFLSPADAAARLLLPRLVYALACASLLAAVIARPARQPAGERSRHALSALSAPLLMLSGRSAPVLALIALAQASALLHIYRAGREEQRRWRLLSLGCGLHALTLSMFHASGHRSSFDALHFAASFTGFESFDYTTQGALLAANTWAAELAAASALPLIAAIASRDDPSRGAFMQTLATLSLTRTALRCAGVAAAAAAATALRRHLHVWSHFAPHFVFSALALLLMDLLTLLAVLLAEPELAIKE